jgi:serine protease Do
MFLCLLAPPTVSAQSALAQTYARVKLSLAFIIYEQGNGYYSGTAFCVGSSDKASYFLTNAHVVDKQSEVSVIRANDSGPAQRGTVLRVNTDIDLALVSIPVPHLPALQIANDVLPEGQPIAVAGYPATHVDQMLDGLGLVPSVHEGMVNSYPGDGTFLEYDAQSEHGNSGGPVFDPQTGIVYGVVRLKIGADQTNLAIPVSRVTGFLANAGVAYTQAARTTEAAKPVPEAQPEPSPTAQRGSPTLASSDRSHFTKRRFATYVPLRNRKQSYVCSNGKSATISIRGGRSARGYEVTTTLSGPGGTLASARAIEAHDANNNVVLLAQYDDAGNTLWLPQPAITVPILPGADVQTAMVNDEGTTSPQTWAGSDTINLWGKHYDTQIYTSEFRDGRSEMDFYADRVGLIAFGLASKTGDLLMVCDLSEITDIP